MRYQIAPPPMNPLTRLLAGILAVLALAGAFFFGIFVLAFAIGVGFMAWLLLWVRLWWIRRKSPPSADRKGHIIDADYTVVSRRDEE